MSSVPAVAVSSSSAASVPRSSGPSSSASSPCLWELDALPPLEEWVTEHLPTPQSQDPVLRDQLWTHVSQSLQSLHESAGPTTARPVQAHTRTLHDPYHIWLQAWRTRSPDAAGDAREADAAKRSSTMELGDEHSDVPLTLGGKLSQLTVGGLMNAMAIVPGGLVHQPHVSCHSFSAARQQQPTVPTLSTPTSPLTLLQLHTLALAWHNGIQARVRADILRTTPRRIQHMLAPELEPHEFAAVRRRVYDTVVRGRGVKSMGTQEDYDDDDDEGHASELATAPPGASSSVGMVDAFKKCHNCGNNQQSAFVLDAKNGDVICQDCGTVVTESLMHEGSQFRKFEGEEDRNHHGDTWNPLYSNAHNLSTTLGGIQVSGGIHGWGAGSKRNLETILRNAHAYTELNVSQFGRTDRKTRIGYKDKQKKEAFMNMQHVGDALNLHEAVIQRAKEIFAGFRDDRELVQQFKPVIGTYVPNEGCHIPPWSRSHSLE